jgi:ABC-type polar amino acid transport system ATPase subunit
MNVIEARAITKEYNDNKQKEFEKGFNEYMERDVYSAIKEQASKGETVVCVTRSMKYSNDMVIEALKKEGFKTSLSYAESFIYIEW